MATPRSQLVDESVTSWYHCVSRCVRRARLCGEGAEHRKDWVVARLRELVEIFAIDCGGFAVMDNHLHLLLRLDSSRVRSWSDDEVARRWLTLFPIRDLTGQPLPLKDDRIQRFATDARWVAIIRGRLADLGWFMKCLKEPLARLANREDDCTGAFWEGRFRSIPLRDEEALLAVAAYIDLNPFAAGAAPTPEAADHTSLRHRIDHAHSQGATASLRDDLSTRTDDPTQEAELWLSPTNDRSDRGGRFGLAPGYTLACHLRLIDAVSRLDRANKASLPRDAASIFARLHLDADHWLDIFHALHRRRPPARLGHARSSLSPPPRPRPAVKAARPRLAPILTAPQP